MQNQQRSRRIFYGWHLVAISAVTLTLKSSGAPSYEGITRNFGWNRTTLSYAVALSRLGGILLGPVEGILVDRFGPRRMIAIGFLAMGLGLILYSHV